MKHVKKFGKVNETLKKDIDLNILNERIEYLPGVGAIPDKINEIIEYINEMRNPFSGMKEIEEFDDEEGPTHG